MSKSERASPGGSTTFGTRFTAALRVRHAAGLLAPHGGREVDVGERRGLGIGEGIEHDEEDIAERLELLVAVGHAHRGIRADANIISTWPWSHSSKSPAPTPASCQQLLTGTFQRSARSFMCAGSSQLR